MQRAAVRASCKEHSAARSQVAGAVCRTTCFTLVCAVMHKDGHCIRGAQWFDGRIVRRRGRALISYSSACITAARFLCRLLEDRQRMGAPVQGHHTCF
jgi:hypothetical protein